MVENSYVYYLDGPVDYNNNVNYNVDENMGRNCYVNSIYIYVNTVNFFNYINVSVYTY